MLDLAFQGMIENIDTKEQVSHISYKDMETLEFQIILTKNYYTNPQLMQLMQYKQLMPTFSPYEKYQYSDAILKHLPKKALEKLQKTMLYSKKR